MLGSYLVAATLATGIRRRYLPLCAQTCSSTRRVGLVKLLHGNHRQPEAVLGGPAGNIPMNTGAVTAPAAENGCSYIPVDCTSRPTTPDALSSISSTRTFFLCH